MTTTATKTDPVRIYVIEHRQGNGNDIVLMGLATSMEKAIASCKANPDIETRDHHWWWAIYVMELDAGVDGMPVETELTFLDWDGNILENQPLPEDAT